MAALLQVSALVCLAWTIAGAATASADPPMLGSVLCVQHPATPSSDTYLWARQAVNSSSPAGAGWEVLRACAPNNISVTAKGHAWAVQHRSIYYNGFQDGVVADCREGNHWQQLDEPGGASQATGIVGSDTAALLLTTNGQVWERSGITIQAPGGTGWTRLSPSTGLCVKAATLSAAGVVWMVDSDGGVHYALLSARANHSLPVSANGLPPPGPATVPLSIVANDEGDLLLLLSGGQVFERNGINVKSSPTGSSWMPLRGMPKPPHVVAFATDNQRNTWLSLQNGSVWMAPPPAAAQATRIFTAVSNTSTGGPRCDEISASIGRLPPPPPPPKSPILPRPLFETWTGQVFSIDQETFAFKFDGDSTGQPDVVLAAFDRYGRILRNAVNRSVPVAPAKHFDGECTELVVTVHDDDESPRPTADMDESYSLSVGHPSASIVAPTAFGALRGLETFSQLVQPQAGGSGVALQLWVTGGRIVDKPAYTFRGLMVDPARRFLPIAALQAQLDAMAYAKLNVMHIHMTDDQSWPLIVPSIPELAQNGAFSPEHTYSLAQIDSLVEYARLRGIRTFTFGTAR